jgi:hypothetical protein
MLNMMDFIRRNNNIVFPGEEEQEGTQDQMPLTEVQDQGAVEEVQAANPDQEDLLETQGQAAESQSGLLLEMPDADSSAADVSDNE